MTEIMIEFASVSVCTWFRFNTALAPQLSCCTTSWKIPPCRKFLIFGSSYVSILHRRGIHVANSSRIFSQIKLANKLWLRRITYITNMLKYLNLLHIFTSKKEIAHGTVWYDTKCECLTCDLKLTCTWHQQLNVHKASQLKQTSSSATAERERDADDVDFSHSRSLKVVRCCANRRGIYDLLEHLIVI